MKQTDSCIPGPESLRIFPVDILQPLDFEALFGRQAPVEVDVGCGDGGFLIASALAAPERDFLGIERLLRRVKKCCARAARADLQNVRLLRLETAYVFRFMLPPLSLARIHILFPDPWPKRRQHYNRLLRESFLRDAARSLRVGGEIRFKTDHADYFAFARKEAERTGLFREMEWPEADEPPYTEFEKRFRAQHLPVFRIRWQKVDL